MPRLTAIRAQNFRCFPQLDCGVGEGVTLFTGDNAQGKTSILEAVCVALRLQSPRADAPGEMALFGQPDFGLSADWGEARLSHHWRGGKRSLAVDGEPVGRPADYLRRSGLIVWMGNDDLALVRGSGEGRRRYLDFLGSQAFPDYRAALLAYDKALRGRNRLLKLDRVDPRELAACTRPLVDHGTQLAALRCELVGEVAPWAAEAHRQVSGREETLALAYQPGTGELPFAEALERAAAEEMRRRVTTVGPHRDDVLLTLDGRPATAFASEGQQRTIALALKLAQARLLEAVRAEKPVLLIDDVFGELDPARRNALLHALPPGTQQLVTTTHLGWLSADFPPALRYTVHAATVRREN